MTALAREECQLCNGSGRLVCCIAYEVEEIGGPRGCRCIPARQGYSTCPECDGTGETDAEVAL